MCKWPNSRTMSPSEKCQLSPAGHKDPGGGSGIPLLCWNPHGPRHQLEKDAGFSGPHFPICKEVCQSNRRSGEPRAYGVLSAGPRRLSAG